MGVPIPSPEQHESLAAWVEAFGAIGAIVAAWWLARQEASRARGREADRLKSLQLATLTALNLAAAEVGNAAARARNVNVHDLRAHATASDRSLDTIERCLLALPVHELGRFEAVNLHSTAVGFVVEARAACFVLSQTQPSSDAVLEKARALFGDVLDGHAEELVGIYRKFNDLV